ncbi:MAG: Bug family tripartite tricarboxylate transporter substrate binding protein [Burkholderiales bacterium]
MKLMAGVLLTCVVGTALAQYPDKPVKLILPYAAGGAGDVLIRMVQPKLEKRLGQPVVIDYRTGAGGIIGTREVVNAPADGYTLLFAPTNNFVINQFLYAKMGFEPLEALAPVTLVCDTPYLIYANGSLPAATFAELVTYTRANVGKLNYGSPGAATVPHLSGYMLSEWLGANMTHVPYKGANPGVQALLANEVQLFIISFGTAGVHVASGKLRALAVAAPTRLPVLPNVPTTKEVGLPEGVILGNWWGIAGPRGMDPAIASRVSEAVRAVLAEDDVRKRYAEMGAIPVGNSPAEFGDRMRGEAAIWKGIIAKTGARADN